MYWEQNSQSQKQGTLEENTLKAQYISVLQELLSQNAHCINLLSATTVDISSLAELANGCKVAMETEFNLHYRFLSVGH